MTTETKGREFEIAAQVAEQLDELPADKQKQVMAMLASRYGLVIKDPPAPTRGGYGARPTRKRSW